MTGVRSHFEFEKKKPDDLIRYLQIEPHTKRTTRLNRKALHDSYIILKRIFP